MHFFSVCNKDFKVKHSSIDGCKKGLKHLQAARAEAWHEESAHKL